MISATTIIKVRTINKIVPTINLLFNNLPDAKSRRAVNLKLWGATPREGGGGARGLKVGRSILSYK
jgi:hypothetical protein